MRSEYGLREGEFDEVDAAWLAAAWARRKRFEARLLALEVWGLAAGSGGGVSQETGSYQRVPEAELLAQMGLGANGRQ